MLDKLRCKYLKKFLLLILLLITGVLTNAQNLNDTIQKNGNTKDSTTVEHSRHFSLEKYLEPLEKSLKEGFSQAIPFSKYKLEMIFIILALSVALFVLGIIRNKRGSILEGKLHVVNLILINLVFLTELLYVMALGANSTWFCKPAEIGWTRTIINFIIFGLVVINQLFRYLHTLRDLQYHSYAVFSWKPGLVSFPIALVLVLIAAYFYKPAIPFIFIMLMVVQLIQVIIIFTRVLPEGGFFHALLCSVVYLLGAISTLVLVLHFISLFIAALIILGLIYLFIGGVTSGKTNIVKYCTRCGSALNPDGNCSASWKHHQHNNYAIYCIYCGKSFEKCRCEKN